MNTRSSLRAGVALLVAILAGAAGTDASAAGTALTSSVAGWTLPVALQRSVVLAHGRELLVLGGLDARDRSTARVFAIDPASGGAPRELARLPRAVHDAAGAIVGGRAIVFGGGRARSYSTVQAAGGRGRPAIVGKLPVPISDLVAATAGDTTYLVAGFDGRRALDGVLATRDGRHFHEIARLPQGLRYAAAAVSDGRLLVIGGDGRHGRPTDEIVAIDLPRGKARVIGHLPRPLAHATAVALDGEVLVMGGRTPAGTTARIWKLNPATGAVAPAGELPYALSDFGAAVLDGKVWLVGGRDRNGHPVASVAVLERGAARARAPAPPPAPVTSAGEPAWLEPATGPGHLRPGSDPSVLPGPLLIADRDNNRLVVVDPQGRVRWEFPRPGDLAHGQTFRIPDDAFFTPDGREIVVTEEDDFVVTLIDIASHRIVWRYGKPGVHGSGPNRLWNPDDAIVLPGGQVLVADIKNCRVLLIAPGAHAPMRKLGSPGYCAHRPPVRWGSPNGAFPMRNGHYLLTEIRGNWVDEIDLTGKRYWSVHPPGLTYPSDTNEVAPGVYLTVNYSTPGTVLIFDRAGKTVWRYRPTGHERLSHPSLALPLPNGMVIANDDANDRVIVIDPKTNRVVWQYGHLRRKGRGPGYLNHPDGMDLVPPHSLLGTHASTMGRP